MTWYDGGPPPDPRHDATVRSAVGAGASRLRAAARGASGLLPGAAERGAGLDPDGAVRGGDGAARAGDGRAQDAEQAARADGGGAPVQPAGGVGTGRVAQAEPVGGVGTGVTGYLEPVGGGGADLGADLDEPDGAVGAARSRLDGLVRWRVPPRTAGIALGALLLVAGAVALRSAGQPTGEPVAVEEPAVTAPAAGQGDAEPGPTPEEATVWVHVVGEVASPGVVAMPAGSRVADAVSAAGGALPGADLTALNLAAVVQDGVQIRVPAPGEEPVAAEAAGDGAGGAAGGGGPASASGGAVDVNAAGAAELQTLPGIGPVLAERIVAWREANGPFASVDALQDVSGIGPAVLGQIRDLVRV